MKTIQPFLIAVCLISAAVSASAAAAPEAAAAIDDMMTEYASIQAFSGALLVADENGVVIEKAYGSAIREWDLPNTVETRFRIGSLSKQFTAAMILRLVDQGRLSLDARLSDILPWYRSDTGSRVTVMHLLNHTSGIDRAGIRDIFGESRAARISLREEVETFCSGELEWEPGENFAYNNSGYLILSAIVENICGMSFADAFSSLILDPAGLANTGLSDSRSLVPRMARGYDRGVDGISLPLFVEPALASGAGGAYSTVGDIYLWDRCLYTDKVLSDSSRELMFTPGMGSYGCGWFIIEMPVGPGGAPRTVIRHPGQGDGFWSIFWRIPEDNVTVVMINNLGRTDLDAMASGALAAVYGDRPRISVAAVMRDAVYNDGFAAAKKLYSRLKADAPDRYDFSESELNGLGYDLLQRGAPAAGFDLLEFNTEIFPDSANAQDSLAEAFERMGNLERAKEFYRKALAIDPEFAHSAERLAVLEK